jgi:hypothetical protein
MIVSEKSKTTDTVKYNQQQQIKPPSPPPTTKKNPTKT